MKIDDMSAIVSWQKMHGDRMPLERGIWEIVMSAWLCGVMALPVVAMVQAIEILPLCFLAAFAPELYVRLRLRLHNRGVLGCAWLCALGIRR